jgi:hypothetical protein
MAASEPTGVGQMVEGLFTVRVDVPSKGTEPSLVVVAAQIDTSASVVDWFPIATDQALTAPGNRAL